MKVLTVYFENSEFEQLKTAKGPQNWHDFLLTLTQPPQSTKTPPKPEH